MIWFVILLKRLMNAQIGEEVNRIILAPGRESINSKVQTHIQDAFARLESGILMAGKGEREEMYHKAEKLICIIQRLQRRQRKKKNKNNSRNKKLQRFGRKS